MRSLLIAISAIIGMSSSAEAAHKSIIVDRQPVIVDIQAVKLPPIQLQVNAEAPAEAKSVFKLRRETRLAALRVVIKGKAAKADRRDRQLLRRALADPDILELALAEAEYIESQGGVIASEESERRPVQDFLQFIIDNWDQIKQIIEFVSGLFGDVPTAIHPDWQQPRQWAINGVGRPPDVIRGAAIAA